LELWDIYTRDRVKTGRLHRRGKPMRRGDYHLVVHIWIRNSKGEYLIQKRADTVEMCPGLWAVTGGSAVAGDDSVTAMLRETKEEMGLTLDIEKAQLIFKLRRRNSLADIWLYTADIDDADITLQKEEVSAVAWCDKSKITRMLSDNMLYNYGDAYYRMLFDHGRRHAPISQRKSRRYNSHTKR